MILYLCFKVLMKLESTFISMLDVPSMTVLMILKCFDVLLCFKSIMFLKVSVYISVNDSNKGVYYILYS